MRHSSRLLITLERQRFRKAMPIVEQLESCITCHAWNQDRSSARVRISARAPIFHAIGAPRTRAISRARAPRRPLARPRRAVVAISPNSNDIHIYSVQAGPTGAPKLTRAWTLREHDALITGLDWAASTNRIVSSSQDRNAYVWELNEGEWKPTLVILRLQRAATSVSWSPDGARRRRRAALRPLCARSPSHSRSVLTGALARPCSIARARVRPSQAASLRSARASGSSRCATSRRLTTSGSPSICASTSPPCSPSRGRPARCCSRRAAPTARRGLSARASRAWTPPAGRRRSGRTRSSAQCSPSTPARAGCTRAPGTPTGRPSRLRRTTLA